MVQLYKDPKGEAVLEPSSATDTQFSTTGKSVHTSKATSHLDEIADLKRQISELRGRGGKGTYACTIIMANYNTHAVDKIAKEGRHSTAAYTAAEYVHGELQMCLYVAIPAGSLYIIISCCSIID